MKVSSNNEKLKIGFYGIRYEMFFKDKRQTAYPDRLFKKKVSLKKA
jgi:hypothetical protein